MSLASTSAFELAGKRVFVAGHGDMVGSAIVRRLSGEDCTVLKAGRAELDLRDQAATRAWFDRHRPKVVFLAVAKVGALLANVRYPVDFLTDNLLIGTNVIDAEHRFGTAKLLFLGSSCIYPPPRGTADRRGGAADRSLGADQRVLRGRQDRRH